MSRVARLPSGGIRPLDQVVHFSVSPRRGGKSEVKLHGTSAPLKPPRGHVRVSLTLALVDDRPEVVRTVIGADIANVAEPDPVPVTSDVVRAIPMGRLMRMALSCLAKEAKDRIESLDEWEVDLDWSTAPGEMLRRRLKDAEKRAEQTRVGPKGYPPSHFKDVAEVYLDALEDGAPTKTVAEHFGVEYHVAAKWVATARSQKYGFLPPTTKGRAALSVQRKRRRKR
ncbi:MAG: hypothetical protein ACRDK3_00520 [Actinomycetota bacterium]